MHAAHDDRNRVTNFEQLPEDLPVPVDDGAAQQLIGSMVPAIERKSTDGPDVSIHEVAGRTVLFGYPRTGTPGEPLPTDWDAIPGARGCTPQACAIRDSIAEFTALGATVFGLSTQSPADQREAAQRLHLPYSLLSDADLALTQAWGLPTFSVDGLTLIRRITIFLTDAVVDGLIYPVFPPDRSAAQALAWLRDAPIRKPAPPPGPPIIGRGGLPHPIPAPRVRWRRSGN